MSILPASPVADVGFLQKFDQYFSVSDAAVKLRV